MIVSIKNQKIQRRYSSVSSLPVKTYRNFYTDSGFRLSENLKALEEKISGIVAGQPLFYYPFFLAICLFVLVTGAMIPMIHPPMASQFAHEISLPQGHRTDHLLLHIGDPNYLLKTDDLFSGPVVESPEVHVLDGLDVREYKVESGDSLSEIAYDFDLKLGTLVNFNNISNVRRLQQGTVLKIPNMDGILYEVLRGESLSSIAEKWEVDYELILDANQLDSPVIHPGMKIFVPGAEMDNIALKQALGELFIWPARGRISSPYGWRNDPITGLRRFHSGLDIANAPGTAIVTVMDGRVGEVGFHSTFGNYVIVNHAGGFQTLYAHLTKASVSRGQWVNQGVRIGTMGSTGYSTGSHLHFTVFKHNQHVDPLNYLR